MEAMIERCAGLDVHQEIIVASVLKGGLGEKPKAEIRTFKTYTQDLEELREWLLQEKVEQVAMESTGVFWKCVWNILEDENYTMILANAREIKNMPGRKTDVKDAQWIAELLRCGLIKPSFVPGVEIRELRDLTRVRRNLVEDLSKQKNRIHKVLQDANIKLTTDLSDIFGTIGRILLEKIIEGKKITEQDIYNMTGNRGAAKLRKKIPELLKGMRGTTRDHHRKILSQLYKKLKYIEEELKEIEGLIEEVCEAYKEEIEIISSIPGISKASAQSIIAEIGTDMTQFPTVKNLTSWAGMSPGNNESAGKKKRGKSTKGNSALRATLHECAWASTRTKNTRISASYGRFVKRMGPQKSVHAIGNLLLKIVYCLLVEKVKYEERTDEEYEKERKRKKESRLIKELEKEGYVVSRTSQL